jgi:VIT1/CCC1 family predicted Fe2+/Mn2+ transporter
MSFTADERRVLIAALVAPLEKVVLLNEEKESISRVLRTVLMQDLIKGNYATLEIVINAAVSSKLPEENRLLLRDALWTIDSIASIGQRSSGLDQGLKAFRKLLASASLSKPSGVRWETDAAMNGGININNIGVEKKSIGGKIQFNDAAMKAIFDSGFNGFTPVFIRMTPVESPLMILGVADQGMNASSG